MILVLNVCKERLQYYEFVKPIEDILKMGKLDFETFHYRQVNDRSLRMFDKIIICGTSILDNDFLKDIDRFKWLRDFDKPVFGICAGFQIIGKVFDGKLKKKVEIGFFKEEFGGNFLGFKRGCYEVYHLHGNYIELGENFDVFCGGNLPQAVKLKGKDIYGVLFHPEVRQKEMILNFCNL